MRPKQFFYLLLGPWLQAILVFAAGSKHGGPALTFPFVLLALIVPVGFYYAAFRNAPLGLDQLRPAPRFVLLGFGAMALSGVGFLYGLMLLARPAP